MSATARIVTDNGYSFDFLGAKTPNGYIPSQPLVNLKDIRVPGVNYNRQRQEHLQFPEFDWKTLAEAPSYEDAIIDAGHYDLSIGHLSSLTVTIRSGTYFYRNVMILAHQQRPIVLPGGCIGPQATSGFTGSIMHVWRLQCTEIQTP